MEPEPAARIGPQSDGVGGLRRLARCPRRGADGRRQFRDAHAYRSGPARPAPIGSGTLINPKFGQIRSMLWDGSSIYHALELSVTQRLQHGLQIRGAYTWGKSIDTGSAAIAGDDFITSMSSPSSYNLKLMRGVSDFNIGQTLVIAGTWQVPGSRSLSGPAAWVTKGWDLNAILKVNTGVPFTPTLGTDGDPLGLNSSDPWDYPNRLTGPGCSSLVNPGKSPTNTSRPNVLRLRQRQLRPTTQNTAIPVSLTRPA